MLWTTGRVPVLLIALLPVARCSIFGNAETEGLHPQIFNANKMLNKLLNKVTLQV
jgi:hypothetical protein